MAVNYTVTFRQVTSSHYTPISNINIIILYLWRQLHQVLVLLKIVRQVRDNDLKKDIHTGCSSSYKNAVICSLIIYVEFCAI